MSATKLFSRETATLTALNEWGYHPSVFFDIGASNGVWSDVIQQTCPQAEYHLFEPLANSPAYKEALDERLARQSNFHLHAVALSDQSGSADIFASHDTWGSSLLDRGDNPVVKERVAVPVARLDEFVSANGLPSPQVIKLDVQGAEHKILRGAQNTLRTADVLFIETWLVRWYGPDTPLLTELMAYLHPLGFLLYELGDEFRDNEGGIYSIDAVFFSYRLAERKKAAESERIASG